jgi:hypothetical protein
VPLHELHGGCHCGNLRVTFRTLFPPQDLPLRSCNCSFCRLHDARTATDPDGSLVIDIEDPALVSQYSFGLRTSEMLICARCGVYVAGLLRAPEARATLNVNVLDAAGELSGISKVVDYSGETREQRIARRLERWTPVTVRTK